MSITLLSSSGWLLAANSANDAQACAGERFVKLRRRDAVGIEKSEERMPHALICGSQIILHEVNVARRK